jgi:hypothetical protein
MSYWTSSIQQMGANRLSGVRARNWVILTYENTNTREKTTIAVGTYK